MKIGIVVYSQTGNTLSVAEKMEEHLTKEGHTVRLERVVPVDPKAVKEIQLENSPEVDSYELLIFGAPVQAFSLSAVMQTYLKQLPDLGGKTVCCYVTQQLKKAWMGGSRSLRQMQAVCAAKGAKLSKTGDIHWSDKKRDEQIDSLIRDFTAL